MCVCSISGLRPGLHPSLHPRLQVHQMCKKKRNKNRDDDDDDPQRSVWKQRDMPYNNEMEHTRAVPKSGPGTIVCLSRSQSLGVSAPQ